jgi:hypothetical protein
MVRMADEWWNNTEYSLTDARLIIDLYNDLTAIKQGFRHRDKKVSAEEAEKYNEKIMKEAIAVLRLASRFNATPREFIMAQIEQYKGKNKFRKFPTLKMMSAPSAVDSWKAYCERVGKIVPEVDEASQTELLKYNKSRMTTIMRTNNVKSEEDFFKNPIFISDLSYSFLQKQPLFIKLVKENYYQENFGMDFSFLS